MPLPASLANTLELPVLGSPLFIVSGPELVIAQCKAGIVGSFPALNARPVEKLDEWLTRIENELGEYKALHPGKKVAPYAVNQMPGSPSWRKTTTSAGTTSPASSARWASKRRP
jgi:nitronate monooxygenase